MNFQFMFPDASASSVVSISSTSLTTTQVEYTQKTQYRFLCVKNSLFRRQMSVLWQRNIFGTPHIDPVPRQKDQIIEWYTGDIIQRQHFRKFTSKLTVSLTFNRETKSSSVRITSRWDENSRLQHSLPISTTILRRSAIDPVISPHVTQLLSQLSPSLEIHFGTTEA